MSNNKQQHQQQYATADSRRQHPQTRLQDDGSASASSKTQQQQQCLEYFGDTDKTRPRHLCTHSTAELLNRLRSLRLRHCCERSALGAIHNEALDTVLRGGAQCVQTLTDLLEADSLAERVTCEMNDILLRYDCRQLYSIKHGCRDCKVWTNVSFKICKNMDLILCP